MTAIDTQVLKAREDQRKTSKRATRDLLRSKKRVEKVVGIYMPDSSEKVELLFRAIGHVEYDKLQSKYPATTEQRSKGEVFDVNKFGPALLAATVIDPEMSREDWDDIWTSPDWSRGECGQLFGEAVNLCTRGLDTPFTAED